MATDEPSEFARAPVRFNSLLSLGQTKFMYGAERFPARHFHNEPNFMQLLCSSFQPKLCASVLSLQYELSFAPLVPKSLIFRAG
jgi:hypothetical protein